VKVSYEIAGIAILHSIIWQWVSHSKHCKNSISWNDVYFQRCSFEICNYYLQSSALSV